MSDVNIYSLALLVPAVKDVPCKIFEKANSFSATVKLINVRKADPKKNILLYFISFHFIWRTKFSAQHDFLVCADVQLRGNIGCDYGRFETCFHKSDEPLHHTSEVVALSPTFVGLWRFWWQAGIYSTPCRLFVQRTKQEVEQCPEAIRTCQSWRVTHSEQHRPDVRWR